MSYTGGITIKLESLKSELFSTLKKFNKTATSNGKIYQQLNINDLIVFKVLLDNEEIDRLTQVKDLSEFMNISRPAVNTILNRLENRSLIERFRLKDDRKSVFVKLTKEAYDLYAVEKEKLYEFMSKIINSLGEDDSKKLIELLEKVNNIMEEEAR